MKLHAMRLRPNTDLRGGIEEYLQANDIDAAALLSCVGSLRIASLRLAAAPKEREFSGPFEIVSSEGTLSRNGCHIHIAVADQNGKVLGGHLGYGSIVRTTAELVLAVLAEHEFRRELDSETGYKELLINESTDAD